MELGGENKMLKSCSYCGSIHDRNYQCPKKPYSKKHTLSDADKFRNTTRWRKKSAEIRARDKGLCQICMRQLYNTQQQYTFDTIEVHHIIPLNENIRYGLSNQWLLSLCKYHHYMADAGDIPRDVQHRIAKEQEQLNQY
jgi:5-methylcytosine-specific restriction endonuclease McrA